MWNFSRLFSNRPAVDNLKNNVLNNRVSHAQLFYGPEGSEVLPAAFAYIKYILCEKKNEVDSCGQCVSCKQVEHLSHPDLKVILPFPSIKDKIEYSKDILPDFVAEIKRNPYVDLFQFGQKLSQEKKSFAIPKRECNELIHFLNLKSYYGGKKAVLIWYPELINTEGMNALLKTLEEPNGSTLILLVSYDINSILPTVLSRCQKTYFKKSNDLEVKLALQNLMEIKESVDIHQLNMLTDNHLGLIVEILMENNPISDYEIFFDRIRQFVFGVKNNFLEVVNVIEVLNNKGREITKYFLMFFQNKIASKLRSNLSVNHNLIEKYSEILDNSIYLVERNVSIKLILFSMIIKMKKAYNFQYNSNLIQELIEI